MEVFSVKPILALSVAGLTGFLIFLTGKRAFYRNLWGVIGSISAFLIVVSMLPGILKGVNYSFLITTLVKGLELKFRVDSFGFIFGLVASSMWVFVNVYTIGYMAHEHHKRRFFSFFALSIFSALGIAFAENLFTLFLFYEFLTICTYPLVMHVGTPEAMKAGVKYLVYTLTGGAFVLLALIITYFLSGTLSFSKPGILSLSYGRPLLYLLFTAYIIGFGVKAAIMPIHHWLPEAMIAPTPVSCLLHAVAVVKAGVFGVLRVVYFVFGVDLLKELGLGSILAGIAIFTIIVGSLIAIKQDNLKRRLAYSTISQLSYIILGAALLAPAAALGALIHIANHAFTKGTLFLCAGTITEETGKKNISELAGIGKRMPLTMIAFTIAALGMMGTPPLAGFVSKWYLGVGALQAGAPVVIIFLLISSLLNMMYFMPISYTAFFRKPPPEETVSHNPHGSHNAHKSRKGEASWLMVVPILGLAAGSVILGLFAGAPGFPLSIAKVVAAFLFQ